MTHAKKIISLLLFISSSIFAGPKLNLTSNAIDKAGWLKPQYAMTQKSKGKSASPIRFSKNISPGLSWHWQNGSQPKNVKSFAILITDPDIPNTPFFDKKGHTIQANDPKVQRVTAYHMVLVNIPASKHKLAKGAASNSLAAKPNPHHIPFALSGFNVYQNWFKSHPILLGKNMKGTRRNFDGPNAPWNDLRIHHYTFTVYALNVKTLKLPNNGKFSGQQALKAMQGHIVAQANLIGKYSNNPSIHRA